jgi:hypothetical protein
LGRIDFGEPIRALPTACTCETRRRRTNAHGQDPDHSRANEPPRVREVAMCTGQQRVARVPPADEEPPGVVLAEETGLLLKTRKKAPDLDFHASGAFRSADSRPGPVCVLTHNFSRGCPVPDQHLRTSHGPDARISPQTLRFD